VVIETDRDANDITLAAGGNLWLGYVSAGTFLATYDPSTTEDTPTSQGDLFLTAGSGRVIGNAGAADADVDLVGDSISLTAGNGIGPLDIAANSLSAQTTSGAVTLSDLDGAGELAPDSRSPPPGDPPV